MDSDERQGDPGVLEGERLVFIASQPRAGSTMLQRMLASHPEIHTCPEPWLLLPSLYPLRHEVCKDAYDLDLARQGLESVLKAHPEGEKGYLRGVGRMVAPLYEELAESAGKRIFLDKTPRYYFILPELRRAFPRATIILLLRNPLAVLISMVRTWTSTRRVHQLFRCGRDLLEGPSIMVRAMDELPDLHVVHYESLLGDPKTVLTGICSAIGVEYTPSMVRYGSGDPNAEALGDHSETLRIGRPDSSNTDRWKEHLADAQLWTLARDYVEHLGPELMRRLGYNYSRMWQILDEHRPMWLRRVPAFSLRTATGGRRYRVPKWKRFAMLGVRAMVELGPVVFVKKVVKKIWGLCCGRKDDDVTSGEETPS
jgi:hypothetical protein